MTNPKNQENSIKQIITIDNKGNISVLRTWTDEKEKLPKEELTRRKEENVSRVNKYLQSQRPKVDNRVKKEVIESLERVIDYSRPHFLITWTFDKKFGWDADESRKIIKNIRIRIIQLFYRWFKGKTSNRPDGFPRMYFFLEIHQDGQYHIHLLMEDIEPDLLRESFSKPHFKRRYERITSKIFKRRRKNKMIITNEMVKKYPNYRHHAYYGKCFDEIPSRYDNWLVGRFLCEYISHFRDGEYWGINQISNSPKNIHSKVIETREECFSKLRYLNKDQYFKLGDHDKLGHLVPEYSDFY